MTGFLHASRSTEHGVWLVSTLMYSLLFPGLRWAQGRVPQASAGQCWAPLELLCDRPCRDCPTLGPESQAPQREDLQRAPAHSRRGEGVIRAWDEARVSTQHWAPLPGPGVLLSAVPALSDVTLTTSWDGNCFCLPWVREWRCEDVKLEMLSLGDH